MAVTRTKPAGGFTLTELAIVLGIIGLILGAIWTAAAKVYANNRVSKAVTEVVSVAGSVRAMYANKGVISTSFVELTGSGIGFGWFPSDMVQTGTCPDGSQTTCPISPWNTAMRLMTNWGGGGVPAGPSTFQFYITKSNTGTGSDCPAFMAAIVQQATSSGLDYIWSSGQGLLAVSTATPITDSHIASCSGDVVLEFKL